MDWIGAYMPARHHACTNIFDILIFRICFNDLRNVCYKVLIYHFITRPVSPWQEPEEDSSYLLLLTRAQGPVFAVVDLLIRISTTVRSLRMQTCMNPIH